MKYLVFCNCGHSLERHDNTGCYGDAAGQCDCRHDPSRALEAAIDDVRSTPWTASMPVPLAAEG